jgi:membrane-bound metal-dependent hydrolase YbcI (DUF457 family)
VPSPVGHSLAGLAVHVLIARDHEDLWDARRVAAVFAAAIAPDVDLLFRFVDGRNHHQAQTHSLGFAVLAGVVAWAWLKARRGLRPGRFGLAVGGAWASHVLLDYLSRDTNPPIGLMALWPLSSGWYKFPWPLFLDIGRTLSWHTVWHDVVAAAWEALVLVPVLLGCVWVRRLAEGE